MRQTGGETGKEAGIGVGAAQTKETDKTNFTYFTKELRAPV